ncbi:MAG: tetratricopeptide repeat-containing sensor histidine kinase [Anaerolineales bacterium]|nr:tetratricopeptide repeat-containing sensor histidine kinase [Anaerolineales bacterium]
MSVKTIHQLEQQLQVAQTTAEFLNVSLELAWCLRDTDRPRAQELLTQASTRCSPEKLKEDAQLALNRWRILVLEGFYKYRQADLPAALAAALEAYKGLKNRIDQRWLCRNLNLLAIIYTQLGNRPTALEYLQEKIKIAEEMGDEAEAASGNYDIGWAYFQAEEYETAAEYFKRSLLGIRKGGNLHNLIINLCNLAAALIHQDQFDEAAVYLGEALAVCQAHPTLAPNMVYQQFGLWYAKQGDYEHAIKQYQKALKITEAEEDSFSRTNTAHALGRVYMQMGQPQQARPYLEEALTTSQSCERQQFLMTSHQLLAEMHKALGDFEQALAHHEQYAAVKEKLHHHSREQTIQNLRTQHQIETVQKEAAWLKNQNELLEQMVTTNTKDLREALTTQEQLAQQLKVALQKEEALGLLKSRIINTVFHEFRTPLTIINTSAALLSKKPERLSTEKRADIYQRIQNAIFFLTDLLEDAVLVEQNEANLQPNYQRRQFNHMWERLAQQLSYELGHPKNIGFIYEEHEYRPIKTDFELLKQILFHLLNNALKYSQPERFVAVEIALHEEDMTVIISDQGMGIPADEVAHVFEAFYRANNSTSTRGIGLGLYIVKQLVEALEGTITAASAGVGKGSTFTIKLPVASY